MARAQQDIQDYTVALSKATEPGAQQDILNNLNSLPESSFTLGILKATRCGKVVGALKKITTNEKVKALAVKLITLMKKAAKTQGYIQTKKIPSAVASASANTSSTSSFTVSSVSSSAPSSSAATVTLTLKTTGNTSRDHVQKKMYRVLKVPIAGASEENAWPSNEKIGAIAVLLEECMNRQANVDVRPRDYMSIVKRLTFNLQNNHDLRSRVVFGLLPPHVLVMLNPAELATKDVQQMRQDAGEHDKGKRRSNWKQANAKEIAAEAGVKNAGVSMYECPGCGSRNCDSFAMQTRGADEPMTIFCTCLDCQNAFRGGNDQAGHD